MPEEEKHIEVVGSGFVPGVPGVFGNNKITHQGEVVTPKPEEPETEEPITDRRTSPLEPPEEKP